MFWRKKKLHSETPELTFVDPQFRRKSYSSADWSGQTFEHFIPVGCRFHDCKFENVTFETACFGGGLEDTLYSNCSFDRSTIRSISPGHARFESCSFRDVEIIQLLGFTVEMVECVVTGIVKQAFFNGAVPEEYVEVLGRDKNEFRGNNFSDATFVDVGFRTGIDLSLQELPKEWRNET